MSKLNQALIKRRLSISQEEFSHHWYKNHAPLVVPMFLYSRVSYYAQIHGPLTATADGSTVNPESWAGAAEKTPAPKAEQGDPQWLDDYYREVVVVDERRFLDRDTPEWFKRIEPGMVQGNKKVIIEGGKSLIDVPEEVMTVWMQYENRGKGKEYQ